jgi:hypothetical protein
VIVKDKKMESGCSLKLGTNENNIKVQCQYTPSSNSSDTVKPFETIDQEVDNSWAVLKCRKKLDEAILERTM